MQINKKKCGILSLGNNKKCSLNDNIKGYPIVAKYVYLGVSINGTKKINSHIDSINLSNAITLRQIRSALEKLVFKKRLRLAQTFMTHRHRYSMTFAR